MGHLDFDIVSDLELRISDFASLGISTSVEMPLQITYFYAKQTQFPKKSNDVNPYNTTDYERKRDWTLGENKPNSNPNKPNLRKAKMNVNLTLTKDYRRNDDFTVRINKPNLVRRRRIAKMNANAFSQKDYENKTAFRLEQNKPNSKPVLSAVEWANFEGEKPQFPPISENFYYDFW